MGRPDAERRLVVNADDFGRSTSINEAVIKSHLHGILTSASLMVNGDAAEEAVELARGHPRLGIGLHLTLVCGRASLPPNQIPQLADARGNFTNNPTRAGLAFFFQRAVRSQLQAEIEAQFQKFQTFGLKLDHVNGHLNLHLHPTVFGILMENAERWGVSSMRLTRDPFWLNARLAEGRWAYRLSHALIFSLLSGRAARALQRKGIRHTRSVFGLLQNACVDEAYLLRLLAQLPDGDSELYSHPSLDEFKHELQALTSPAVRKRVAEERIELTRYQDL